MGTIYISGGKKDNLRPGDILGALTKNSELKGTDVGEIHVLDINSYVAIALDNAHAYEDLEKLAQSLEQRVTERTQDLQAANERLQELDQLKSAFVSIVSHDLRNPLGVALAAADLLLDLPLDEKQRRRQAEIIRRSGERMQRLIEDLLDVARIEAGAFVVRPSRENLAPILAPHQRNGHGVRRHETPSRPPDSERHSSGHVRGASGYRSDGPPRVDPASSSPGRARWP